MVALNLSIFGSYAIGDYYVVLAILDFVNECKHD